MVSRVPDLAEGAWITTPVCIDVIHCLPFSRIGLAGEDLRHRGEQFLRNFLAVVGIKTPLPAHGLAIPVHQDIQVLAVKLVETGHEPALSV